MSLEGGRGRRFCLTRARSRDRRRSGADVENDQRVRPFDVAHGQPPDRTIVVTMEPVGAEGNIRPSLHSAGCCDNARPWTLPRTAIFAAGSKSENVMNPRGGSISEATNGSVSERLEQVP